MISKERTFWQKMKIFKIIGLNRVFMINIKDVLHSLKHQRQNDLNKRIYFNMYDWYTIMTVIIIASLKQDDKQKHAFALL